MHRFIALIIGCAHIVASRQTYADQTPLRGSVPRNAVNTTFHGVEALDYDHYTRLEHPEFPRHGVRVKKTNLCDGVTAYTGYIDVEARHLWFWLTESDNNPSNDPVVFWTNGGPGASSSLALYGEFGPCRVLNENTTVPHPYAWNRNASVIYIDQPIGVGFSYADHGEYVSTTEEAAVDAAAFIAILFEHFTQFKDVPFHMAGESYGGRYIPLFAAELYDQNTRLAAASGIKPVNITSVIIGNGLVDTHSQFQALYDFQCTSVGKTVLDISTCVRMKQVLARCKKWQTAACIEQFEHMNCQAASDFCLDEFMQPYVAQNRNPYDITQLCEVDDWCYKISKDIYFYLLRSDVQANLGTDVDFSNGNQLATRFHADGDFFHENHDYVAALLHRGIKALVYVGTYDFVCNWVGVEQWTLKMEWVGQGGFAKQSLRPWTVNGHPAGKTRSYGGLTYATVEAAGHLVPYDKPKESLEMLNRWLFDGEL
ncbi:carboxypeptidase Y [Punctularia strigosozonata HHB-11173 SS5]|uniref:carboxypeptidase Y n=1 Tax=Punctularia strigosozonata (strain HHB-11173) TaxID=741275 RepID=UPI0004418621|nr:carboxypeptidase Y [Punctularia strigosozonata HHB-11173 SS5]EIN09424.1 carboxypeptidase Y [Punctularia strigosozonata HHB-11173 SS5]